MSARARTIPVMSRSASQRKPTPLRNERRNHERRIHKHEGDRRRRHHGHHGADRAADRGRASHPAGAAGRDRRLRHRRHARRRRGLRAPASQPREDRLRAAAVGYGAGAASEGAPAMRRPVALIACVAALVAAGWTWTAPTAQAGMWDGNDAPVPVSQPEPDAYWGSGPVSDPDAYWGSNVVVE